MKAGGDQIFLGRVQAIRGFYDEQSRMPSFSEIGKLVGLHSKNAVSKLVKKLEHHRIVLRDATGRLIPGVRMAAVKVLGTVEAGFPSPAEEELLDTISLDAFLIRNREASFLLKVSGDSMIEAGILEGDLVIVDRSRKAKNGDIVVAEVDGAWTMKYFRKRGNDITLVPANAKYQPIQPKEELRVAGVVTAVIRKYGA